MKNPCLKCSKWGKKEFPDCRNNCKKSELYLSIINKYQPSLKDYTYVPWNIGYY